MTPSLLARYPNWLATQMETGNFGAVSMAYFYPAEIEYDGKCYLVESPGDLVRGLATYHAVFNHFALRPHKFKLNNRPNWTSKHFRVFVEQEFRAPGSDQAMVAQLEFFLKWRKFRPGICKVVVHKLPHGRRIAAQRVVKALETSGRQTEPQEKEDLVKVL